MTAVAVVGLQGTLLQKKGAVEALESGSAVDSEAESDAGGAAGATGKAGRFVDGRADRKDWSSEETHDW